MMYKSSPERRDAPEDMRREFTANVSHELKTPITSISGYAEMMVAGIARREDWPKLAEKIYDESRRLITLIDDIIRLSRLDEGSINEHPAPVDLGALARRCAERLEVEAARCGVTVAVRGAEVSAMGSEALIEEMLMNLCDNGIKYNREGGRVVITTGEREGFPCFSVEDNGIGIAPEHLGRVFERFYRVDKSRSKDTGGTGLGLSIVKHAAAWHRASIEAESAPDRGTRITIVFDGKGGE